MPPYAPLCRGFFCALRRAGRNAAKARPAASLKGRKKEAAG